MAGTITPAGGSPITVDILSGYLFSGAQRQETWEQPGVNGVGAHVLAKGNSQFEFTLVKYSATSGDRNTWKASLYALKDKLVTIVDDDGESHTSLLIESFSRPVEWTIFKDGSSTKTKRTALMISGVKAVE